MEKKYVIVYYRNGEIVHESNPRAEIGYPARTSVRNEAREKFDYAVIEERYYFI